MPSPFWEWDITGLWQSCDPATRQRAQAFSTHLTGDMSGWQALLARQAFLPGNKEKLAALCEVQATQLRSCSRELVVIGAGGASLAGQSFCALAEHPGRVHFWENCDPATSARIFALNKATTGWCIISKSGETVETLAAALALIGEYTGAAESLRHRVCVITGAGASSLARLARAQGWPLLPHPDGLGGRFSAFSLVGLLPAAYAGLDPRALLHAAQAVYAANMPRCSISLAHHAAWYAANLPQKPMHLLMAYADRLRPATQWYKQLRAESLGKDGKGPTPVTAIGALDQHSQLQLYLDGPRDKLMTLWLPDHRGQGNPLPHLPIDGLAYLGGHRMGAVMHATAEATAISLHTAGVPLRVLRGVLTAETLAAWMMEQILETLAVALLLGVDPYSQPAVERGKRRTRVALGGQA